MCMPNLLGHNGKGQKTLFIWTTLIFVSIDSLELSFERRIYYQQVEHNNGGTTASLKLTRDLHANETISHAAIVGVNIEQFFFNITSLSVCSIESLIPGRYEFLVVITIDDSILMAAVVVNALAPSESCCFYIIIFHML